MSYVTFRGPNWASDELRLRTRAAAVEVGRPIAFATLIVIAVFFPLFAMTGIEERLYSPLAAAVIAAIAPSLVLALTLVPVSDQSKGGLYAEPF